MTEKEEVIENEEENISAIFIRRVDVMIQNDGDETPIIIRAPDHTEEN